MSAELKITGKVGTIILTGIFDFSAQDAFRQIIAEALENKSVRDITVDMAGVTFMDSSAIRLLLLLNKDASGLRKSLAVINCQDALLEIFAIGGFDKVLTIR